MKSRKPAPSTRFAACCGQATRAVSQAWKWRTNGLRRVRTAIVAGISWRFATDYNLVARFGTESTDGERSIMHRTLACAVLLAHAHAFIPARHLARQKNTLVASMPDGLEAWGCDDLLWTQIPPGARRDLTRFARDGEEQLARNRLQTMREVISFVDAAADAPWEKAPWDTAVITWEADQAHQEAERKAAEKAAKAAAAKAKREAAAAAKAAAEAA